MMVFICRLERLIDNEGWKHLHQTCLGGGNNETRKRPPETASPLGVSEPSTLLEHQGIRRFLRPLCFPRFLCYLYFQRFHRA